MPEAVVDRSVEEARAQAFAQAQQHEAETIDQTAKLSEGLQQLEQEGGIDAHRNRYEGDMSACPFLNSLGAAGIELVKEWQEAEKNPAHEKEKTMGEILAELLAEEAAEEALAAQKDDKVKDDDHVSHLEAKPIAEIVADAVKEVPLHIELARLVEDHKKHADKVEVAPTQAAAAPVRSDVVPVTTVSVEAHTPAPKVIAEARTKPVVKKAAAVPLLVKEPSVVLPHVEAPVIVDTPHQVVLVQAETLAVPFAFEAIAQDESYAEASPSLAEAVSTEEPFAAPDIEVVISDVETEFTAFAETSEVDAQFFEIVQPLMEEQAEQLEVFETYMNAWLTAEAAEDSEELFLQLVATPEVGQTEPSEAQIEKNVKVFATLEAISAVYGELKQTTEFSEEREVVIEKLEGLVKELFEQLDFIPSDAVITAVVQDIVAKLSLDELNNRGTNEHKHSIVSTLQDHFVKAMHQKIARFMAISRYILAKVSTPFNEQLAAV